METILKRKLLTGIVSSILFACILFFYDGSSFNANGFFNLLYLNLFAVLTYGVLMSSVIDWFTSKVFKNRTVTEVISFLLHCIAGLVLLLMGLISAICFYLVDRFIRRFQISWFSVIIALIATIVLFIFLVKQ